MEKGKVGRKLCKVQKQGSVDAKGSRWVTWAWLLKYVFDVDGWACRECNKRMKLRTVVIRPPVTDTIILGLRGSEEGNLGFGGDFGWD